MAKAKKTTAKKKAPVKKAKKPKVVDGKFEEINKAVNEGLTVGEIFTIEFVEEDEGGAIMNIGFTELGDKAISALRKRNPKIKEKDIEEYVRGISARLIVFLSEKIKEQDKKPDDEEQPT
jgi:hypothetical protein